MTTQLILSDELWWHVFEWLPPLELLQSVSKTSRYLQNLLRESYWRVQCAKLLANNNPLDLVLLQDPRLLPSDFALNQRQLKRLCLILYQNKKTPWKQAAKLPQSLRETSLLRKSNTSSKAQMSAFCWASSTYMNCFIENILPTLPSSNNRRNRVFIKRWWCSAPDRNPNSSETFLFGFNDLAAISKIKLKHLIDPYKSNQSFTWKETQVKAYRVPQGRLSMMTYCSASSSSSNAEVLLLLRDVEPIYQTPRIPTQAVVEPGQASTEHETIYLSENSVVLTNLVAIQLYGKNTMMSTPGEGYCVCVDEIDISGVVL